MFYNCKVFSVYKKQRKKTTDQFFGQNILQFQKFKYSLKLLGIYPLKIFENPNF